MTPPARAEGTLIQAFAATRSIRVERRARERALVTSCSYATVAHALEDEAVAEGRECRTESLRATAHELRERAFVVREYRRMPAVSVSGSGSEQS